MSHSRLGRQSYAGKALGRIDWVAATPALENNPSANIPCAAAVPRRIDRQAQAEGRQFENARITS